MSPPDPWNDSLRRINLARSSERLADRCAPTHVPATPIAIHMTITARI